MYMTDPHLPKKWVWKKKIRFIFLWGETRVTLVTDLRYSFLVCRFFVVCHWSTSICGI